MVLGKDKNGQPLWIQGSSDEVICLGFMLDMGCIGEDRTFHQAGQDKGCGE